MSLQRVDITEAPEAVWLLLPVVLHVVFEQRAEREANTATDGADVGLLSGVRPHADRHGALVAEVLCS